MTNSAAPPNSLDLHCKNHFFLTREGSPARSAAARRGTPITSPSIDNARANVCNAAIKRVTAFAVLLVVLATPAWAGWEESIAAYNRGDYVTAFREILPLAEQGDAVAQRSLGLLYHNGQGVPQDSAEAVTWYRIAAEQGYAGAQHSLGFMYARGQGVPQDYAEAHFWFILAGAGLPPGEDRDRAAKSQDVVAKHMTADQVAGSQRRAEMWRPRGKSGATLDN